MASIIISASILRYVLTCERRVWLDVHGDEQQRSDVSATTRFMRQQGIQHEDQIRRETMPHATVIPVADWAESVQLTRDLIARKTSRISGSALEAKMFIDGLSEPVRLRGKMDQLIYRNNRYTIIEIKKRKKLNKADQIQMDLYVWLVQQATGQLPRAVFWFGSGSDREEVPHTYQPERLRTVTENTVQLLQKAEQEPSVHMAAYCKRCHWQTYCTNRAERQLDLSLLNGITKKSIQDMQQNGIHTLHQVVEMPAESLKQFYGIVSTAHRFHAQARAWVEDRPIRCGEIPDVCYTDAWFFDIETNPRTNEVWSIGWGRADGVTHAAVVAPDIAGSQITLSDEHQIYFVSDYQSAWQLFASHVQDDEVPIFHWSHFDATNMRRFVPEIYAQLEDRLSDLCRIFKMAVQIPRQGGSLKVVAPYVGFQWRAYEDWSLAWKDYQKWLKSKDDAELYRLSQYQMDDVLAMIAVHEWLID